MREIIMTGKTVEQATELALEELGLTREEVSIEIIDMPQKKLFKTIPAKIKATAVVDDISPIEPKATAPVAQAPVSQAPVLAATKANPASPISPKPQPTGTRAPRPSIRSEEVKAVDFTKDEKALLAANYIKEVCEKMGIQNVQLSAEMHGEALIFKIDGTDVGALIGRRGETMESLSYLSSLVANRAGGDYIKIGLDVGGYREKRENDLESLARKVCDKVNKTNRAQMLEPMNPYERRIIHSAVGEMQGVRSESTGEGSQRRVVVLSTAEGARNERPDRYDKSSSPRSNSRPSFNKGGFKSDARPPFNKDSKPSGYKGKNPSSGYKGNNPSGGYKGNNPSRPATNTPERTFATRPRTGDAPVAPARTDSINDGGDMPLYGKVDI